MRRNTEIFSRVAGILLFVGLIALFCFGLRYEPLDIEKLRFDEKPEKTIHKSTDLEKDRKLMWKTVKHTEFPVSPISAINAASRVFATIDLVGKTTNEVFVILGHNERSNDSGYNFPFFPVHKNTVVYRFDCGNFGWQFNLKTDSSGRVTNVERQGIY